MATGPNAPSRSLGLAALPCRRSSRRSSRSLLHEASLASLARPRCARVPEHGPTPRTKTNGRPETSGATGVISSERPYRCSMTYSKRKPCPSGRGTSDRHRRDPARCMPTGVVCRRTLNGKKLAVGLGSATRESEDSKSDPVPFESVHRGRKDRQADGTARAPSSGTREGGRPCTPPRENGAHAASGYPTLPHPHTGPKSCARTETPRRLRRRVEVAPVGRAWATTTLAAVV